MSAESSSFSRRLAVTPVLFVLWSRTQQNMPRPVAWGFAQFDDGKSASEAMHETCFRCRETVRARDFVFNRYAP
jgi:Cytochrome P460